MNIVFITPEYVTENNWFGGLSQYLTKISEELAKNSNDRVVVIVPSEQQPQRVNHKNVHVIRVSSRGKWYSRARRWIPIRVLAPFDWLYQSWRCNKVFLEQKFDEKNTIVQYSSYSGMGFFKSKKYKSIVRLSSYQPWIYRESEIPISLSTKLMSFIEKRSCLGADYIFAPSKIIANKFSDLLKRKIDVFETPLPDVEVNMELLPKEFRGMKYLLFFGKLCVLKGVVEISEILYDVLLKYPELNFVFAGKDTLYKGEALSCILQRGAAEFSNRILFVGNLKRDELTSFIKGSYACLLPSRIDNLPNSCLEAMMLRKIVIGTRGASFEQLIDHGRNGFLCEIRSSKTIMECIDALMSMSELEKNDMEEKSFDRVKSLDIITVTTTLRDQMRAIIASK